MSKGRVWQASSALFSRKPPHDTSEQTIWAEAGVYYSESNIKELHIEAETMDGFGALVRELAPEMIRANHTHRYVQVWAVIPLRFAQFA